MLRSANDVWLDLLAKVYSSQRSVSPRGLVSRELLGNQTVVDMTRPVVTMKARKLGRRFMVAEAWWILSGKNDVESIAPYSKEISKFSNDGIRFDGAYGVKVVDQLRYVVDSLVADRDTRQAVINIWRENPRPSKDIPCTLSLQFLIREGRLNCVATMRSSDVWLGVVYDWFNFSSISAYISLVFKSITGESLPLGALYLTVGSQHIYETNFKSVEAVFDDPQWEPYEPLDIEEFQSPAEFMVHLGSMRDRVNIGKSWLKELL